MLAPSPEVPTPWGMAEAHGLATRTIDSDGVRLHCVTAGRPDDPMVLFLHGFPARWSTWRRPMHALASAGFFAVTGGVALARSLRGARRPEPGAPATAGPLDRTDEAHAGA